MFWIVYNIWHAGKARCWRHCDLLGILSSWASLVPGTGWTQNERLQLDTCRFCSWNIILFQHDFSRVRVQSARPARLSHKPAGVLYICRDDLDWRRCMLERIQGYRYVLLHWNPLSRSTYTGRFSGNGVVFCAWIVLCLTGIHDKPGTFATTDQSGLTRHICVSVFAKRQFTTICIYSGAIFKWIRPHEANLHTHDLAGSGIAFNPLLCKARVRVQAPNSIFFLHS